MPKQKILLADDVMLLLEIEKSFLDYSPVTVLMAVNAEQALALARRERPALAVIDIQIRLNDGTSCYAAFKKDPELRSMPLIGVADDPEECREAGYDGLLIRPVDRRLFLEMAHRFVPAVERREPRVSCRMPVSYRLDEWEGCGESADISVGGMYVAAEEKPAAGPLSISFTLLDVNSTSVEAKGRLAWHNDGKERKKHRLPPGFGIEFTHVDEKTLEAIRSFVDDEKAGR